MSAVVQPKSESKAARAHFQWDDPFLLEEQLTDDERMIRDTARDYAQDKLAAARHRSLSEEKTDRAIFNEMGELGLLGVTIPEAYGGAGELCRLWAGRARSRARRFRLPLDDERAVLAGHVSIYAYGNEAQKQKYLPQARDRRMDRLFRPDRA